MALFMKEKPIWHIVVVVVRAAAIAALAALAGILGDQALLGGAVSDGAAVVLERSGSSSNPLELPQWHAPK
jgi:hypothetical protein